MYGSAISAVSFLSAAASLGLGILVYGRHPRQTLHRVFLLLCLTNATGSLFVFGLSNAGSAAAAERWVQFWGVWPLSVSLIAHFSVLYTGKPARLLQRQYAWLLYLPAPIFIFLKQAGLIHGLLTQFAWGWGLKPLPGPAFNIFIAFTSLLTLFAGILILHHTFRQSDYNKRQQSKFVALGIWIPILFAMVTQVFFPMKGTKTPPLMDVATTLEILLIGYAIWSRAIIETGLLPKPGCPMK